MLEQTRLDGPLLIQALETAGRRLREAQATLNRLNVFPVPDGDTGTNLVLTFEAGLAQAVRGPHDSAGMVLARFSRGLLLGARGNSGVILSQLFLAMAERLQDLDAVAPEQWAEAWSAGARKMYAAVQEPVEGTMLTVARAAAEAFLGAAGSGWDKILKSAWNAVQAAVRSGAPGPSGGLETEAVDSGALGLAVILGGFVEVLAPEAEVDGIRPDSFHSAGHGDVRNIDRSDMPCPAYGYCTEFLIHVPCTGEWRPKVEQALMPLGDSRLVVQLENVIKVHIHTLHPGQVLESALSFGPLSDIKIDNMQLQVAPPEGKRGLSEVTGSVPAKAAGEREPAAGTALIVVVEGAGLARLFADLGVLEVLGGRSLGAPEFREVERAVREAGASQVVILVHQEPEEVEALRAAQAAERAGVTARVVRAGSVPEGLAAACAFDPCRSLQENEQRMRSAMGKVRSGVLCRASGPSFRRFGVQEGAYVGLVDDEVIAVGDAIAPVFHTLIEKMASEHAELVTVIWGERIGQGDETACRELAHRAFPGVSFEWLRGDQSTFDVIVGVE